MLIFNTLSWSWTKSKPALQFFSICRWLHIYLSSLLFSLLLFFCVTGITLNHTEWLSQRSDETNISVKLPPVPNSTNAWFDFHTKSTLALEQFISNEFDLTNPRSIDMDMELNEISFDYPLPAGYAFITIDLNLMTLQFEHKQGEAFAVLNDLHKGRHTGAVWSLLLDVSALVIILFSITGLILLLQQRKRRDTGLMLLLLGTLTPFILYFLFVPH